MKLDVKYIDLNSIAKGMATLNDNVFKEVRHIEMPKAAPKSPFVFFKN